MDKLNILNNHHVFALSLSKFVIHLDGIYFLSGSNMYPSGDSIYMKVFSKRLVYLDNQRYPASTYDFFNRACIAAQFFSGSKLYRLAYG